MNITPSGILLIGGALLTGCAGDGPTAPTAVPIEARTYELPYRGSLTLQVPDGWQDEVLRAPGGLATTVEFRPVGDQTFRVALNVRWSLAGDPAFNGAERVRRYVRENLDVLDGSYSEDAVTPEPLSGPQVSGELFRVSHTAEHLLEGRYARRLQAVLAVDDLLLGAVLVSDDADPALERRFIDMLAGIARLRASDLETRAAAPALADGVLVNVGAGYRMAVPAGWSLRPVSNTQLMMLDRAEGPATFSILLKPAVGELAEEFKMLEDGMRARPGVEIVDQRGHTVGDLPAIRMESRANVDGTSFSTRNYVTVFGGAAYFMGVETADAVRPQVFDEVETMVASIELGAGDTSQ